MQHTKKGKSFYVSGGYFIEIHYEWISNIKKKVIRVFVKASKAIEGQDDDAVV